MSSPACARRFRANLEGMRQRPARRKSLPPEVPVVSPGVPQVRVPAEAPAPPAGETDMTEDAIRKMLEAAYT